MQYTLKDQGLAEGGHIDGLDGLETSYPALVRMALAGHPGAFEAIRLNRDAYRAIVSANEAINGTTKQAA